LGPPTWRRNINSGLVRILKIKNYVILLHAPQNIKFIYSILTTLTNTPNLFTCFHLITNNKLTSQAGIEDNDLNRKVQNMISYLKKGHPCQVAITSNRRHLRQDSDAVITTLGRVSELIGDNGKQQGQMKKNTLGSRGVLLFQPISKKTGWILIHSYRHLSLQTVMLACIGKK